jgi:hypothetical protein
MESTSLILIVIKFSAWFFIVPPLRGGMPTGIFAPQLQAGNERK